MLCFITEIEGFDVQQVPLPIFTSTLLESLVPGRKSTQLLVRVKAAAINPIDFKLPLPLLPFLRWVLPNGVGRDFAGVVEMVVPGNDDCSYKIGDEIFGIEHCALSYCVF